MHSLGIDLSTDPKKVWICQIAWDESPPRITSLIQLSTLPDPLAVPGEPPASTARGSRTSSPAGGVRSEPSLIAALVDRIVDFAPSRERVIGIDAPLGWPSAFVEAVADWDDGDLHGFRKRADLRLRATDRFVQALTGVTPMSVSTDRMGSTSMLLAEVLSRAAARLDRGRFDRASGVDGIAEVHPPAALRLWTHSEGQRFTFTNYRTASYSPSRDRLVRELIQSGIDVSREHCHALLTSGDAVDALLCALIARSVAIGQTFAVGASVDLQHLVPKGTASPKGETIEQTTERLDTARAVQAEAQRTAETEGWIHLPMRADLSAALGLTPGSASFQPAPSVPYDPFARWSNGDGGGYDEEPVSERDEYGPISRFVGPDDYDDWDDEYVLVRRSSLGDRELDDLRRRA